ncbi:D-Ala-D-Ala carboxypeptidase family metallohydrolase [Flavobacterium sp.]|jgi:zinc D-Ala-D-Ala carboxypeptidase|uniref:D-Ala-D-Ala carboxypeptidase family metallohydrolase n=1 Tax=Flavobacterium sp. TaxID=239 RepID=UPI0037C09A12
MNLSANFTLAELTHSDTAIKHKLDNTPGETEVVNLKTLCENVLQKVRDHYKKAVKVNSGFRHPLVNAAVRGSKVSDHCFGQAADIEIMGLSNPELAQWIIDNLDFTQVILEFYKQGDPNSGWVHVSYVPGNLKKEVLTAVLQDGKTVYLKGLHA